MTDARVHLALLADDLAREPALETPDAAPPRALRDPRVLLGLYSAALALIAFWPVPVDRDAGWLVAALTRAIPFLTYDVVEVTANVLLFVPLGILFTMVFPALRGLVVPCALALTLVIETGQALVLAQRTPSLRDIAANVLGAGVGLLIVWMAHRRAARRDPHLSPSPA